MKKLKNHFNVWRKWCKSSANSIWYKLFVLFGIIHSPLFELDYYIELYIQEHGYSPFEIFPYKDAAQEFIDTMEKESEGFTNEFER